MRKIFDLQVGEPKFHPQTVIKKLDLVVNVCNPSAVNGRVGRSLGFMASQPGLISELQVRERACLIN